MLLPISGLEVAIGKLQFQHAVVATQILGLSSDTPRYGAQAGLLHNGKSMPGNNEYHRESQHDGSKCP